jgi:S-DNA-T family DNA segregation ATPase FtsK/SpoIIIE
VVTTRLVLRMAEREEYALLGLDSSAVRAVRLPPGRGFIQGSTEVQVAVLASGDGEVEHRALLEAAERARSRWPDRTPPLAAMPPSVATSELPDPVTPWALPFAVGDAEVAPVVLDLSDAHALVAGPPRSGRTTVLDGLAVAARRAASPVSLVRITARRRHDPEPLAWDVGPVDAHDSGELTRALATVSALASQGRPVLCLVDDADALSDSASSALADLARRGRDELVRVVAAVDNRWAARAYGGVVPEVRKSKLGVLLAPEIELDGDLVGVRLRAPLERLGPPGRGYLVQHGVTELVQVAQFGDDGVNDREGPSAAVGALGT